MKYLLFLVALPALLFTLPLSATSSLIFSDDFEAYDLGDDIAINGTWLNCDPTTFNNFIVVDDGSDQGICGFAVWKGDVECKYMVAMYGYVGDGSAKIDFIMDELEACQVELILRFWGSYPDDWECYHGCLLTGIDRDMALMSISYVHNGTAQVLNELLLYDFDISSWHTLQLTTVGDAPAVLSLMLDDEQEVTAEDNPAQISFGSCILGLVCSSTGGSSNFILDNYELWTIIESIQPTSVGKIKSLFQ